MRIKTVLLSALLAGMLLQGCGQMAENVPVQTVETKGVEVDSALKTISDMKTETTGSMADRKSTRLNSSHR